MSLCCNIYCDNYIGVSYFYEMLIVFVPCKKTHNSKKFDFVVVASNMLLVTVWLWNIFLMAGWSKAGCD